jgi:alkylation response protein AidB-like acyl-CoA dehydrogenase
MSATSRAHEGGFWQRAYLNSFSATIGGGTSQVQANIMAEHVLGLPKVGEAHMSRDWQYDSASLDDEERAMLLDSARVFCRDQGGIRCGAGSAWNGARPTTPELWQAMADEMGWTGYRSPGGISAVSGLDIGAAVPVLESMGRAI